MLSCFLLGLFLFLNCFIFRFISMLGLSTVFVSNLSEIPLLG